MAQSDPPRLLNSLRAGRSGLALFFLKKKKKIPTIALRALRPAGACWTRYTLRTLRPGRARSSHVALKPLRAGCADRTLRPGRSDRARHTLHPLRTRGSNRALRSSRSDRTRLALDSLVAPSCLLDPPRLEYLGGAEASADGTLGASGAHRAGVAPRSNLTRDSLWSGCSDRTGNALSPCGPVAPTGPSSP